MRPAISHHGPFGSRSVAIIVSIGQLYGRLAQDTDTLIGVH